MKEELASEEVVTDGKARKNGGEFRREDSRTSELWIGSDGLSFRRGALKEEMEKKRKKRGEEQREYRTHINTPHQTYQHISTHDR